MISNYLFFLLNQSYPLIRLKCVWSEEQKLEMSRNKVDWTVEQKSIGGCVITSYASCVFLYCVLFDTFSSFQFAGILEKLN